MIDWLLGAVFFGCVLATGLALTLCWRGQQQVHFLEVFGLSAVAGAGLMGLLLVWCSLAGWTPTALLVIIFGVGFLVFDVILLWKGPLQVATGTKTTKSLLIVSCLAVIVFVAATVGVHTLLFPLYEWDAFAIWGLKAKVLLQQDLASQPQYFRTLPLSYSHLDYPLLVPSLLAGGYALMGTFNEPAAKAVFFLMFLGFGALFYAELQRRLTTTVALAATALLMSVPEWVRWAGTGLADVPLALFYGSAVIFSLRWLKCVRHRDLAMMLLFLLLVAHTKNEGLPIAVMLIVLTGIAQLISGGMRKTIALGLGSVTFAALYLPWALFSRTIPKTHENYANRINWTEISANFARLDDVFSVFLQEFRHWWHWGIIWLVLIVSVVLAGRQVLRREPLFLWSVLLLHLALYFVIFLVTPWDVKELSATALNRLLLHLLPVAVLIVAIQTRELLLAEPDGEIKKREG